MKLEKKTEKALLMGAALLFVLLVLIAVALLLSPEDEESAPTATPAPTATATPLPTNALKIGGKAVASDADTFYLHKTTLSETDKASLATLRSLKTLSLTDCGLTDVGFLAELPQLTALYLSNNSLMDLTPLSALSSLRTLYLDGNPVTDLSPLYSLSALQTLSLQSVPLTRSALTALENALPGCKVFDDAVSGSARPLTLGGLSFTAEDTELYLSNRGISDISTLSACTKLRVLDLSGNPLDGVGVLKQLSTLNTLNLSNTGLTDSGLRIIMGIRSLSWLNVSGNAELSGEVLDELLSALPNCTIIHDEPSYKIKLGTQTLQSSIEELSMPSARLVSISPLKKCLKLKTVDLSHNYLSDLTPLASCTELRTLILEDNRIQTCEGLYPLSSLDILDLSDNLITDVSALSGCMYLSWLDLSNNNLSYLSPLYLCINLRYLDLSGNPIDWDTLQALRAALPLCEIISDVSEPLFDEPIDEADIIMPDL